MVPLFLLQLLIAALMTDWRIIFKLNVMKAKTCQMLQIAAAATQGIHRKWSVEFTSACSCKNPGFLVGFLGTCPGVLTLLSSACCQIASFLNSCYRWWLWCGVIAGPVAGVHRRHVWEKSKLPCFRSLPSLVFIALIISNYTTN